MVVYILVTAVCPPSEMNNQAKVALATRMDYPPYIKKLYDIGSQYTNYTLYKCEDAKLADAYRFIGARYHKIAAQVPGYDFTLETCLDTPEAVKLLELTGE
jgi:hypothetical protein